MQRAVKDSGELWVCAKGTLWWRLCVVVRFLSSFSSMELTVLTGSFCPVLPLLCSWSTHSLQCLGPCAVGLILRTVTHFPHSTDVRACLLVPNTGLELPGKEGTERCEELPPLWGSYTLPLLQGNRDFGYTKYCS